MNWLRWLNKRGISTDILVIILMIAGLAIFVVIFLLLSSGGKSFLGGLANLSLAP